MQTTSREVTAGTRKINDGQTTYPEISVCRHLSEALQNGPRPEPKLPVSGTSVDYERLGQASAALKPKGLHCLLEKSQKNALEFHKIAGEVFPDAAETRLGSVATEPMVMEALALLNL
ncbi:hypothetical protein K438DRAFT_1782465 [Mycena galopus ATCC 62051]|nr:hypothetical protein K438DRAFT_1782465 [Mycena galopus ATCC 62051]